MTPDGVELLLHHAGSTSARRTTTAPTTAASISNGEPVIYANEPYDATIPGCDAGSSPNGNDADSTINTISHEQNEAITDPWGMPGTTQAATRSPTSAPGSSALRRRNGRTVDAYNQVINGHHYWLQQEYSNDGSACLQHYDRPAGEHESARPHRVPRCWASPSLQRQGSWTQAPTAYAYQWLRCAANGTNCTKPSRVPRRRPTRSSPRTAAAHWRCASRRRTPAARPQTVDSKQSAVVLGAPAVTKAPHISGRARVGRQLTADPGLVDRAAEEVPLPVAPLQRPGRILCPHPPRDAPRTAQEARRPPPAARRVTAVNAAGSATATSRATSRVARGKS